MSTSVDYKLFCEKFSLSSSPPAGSPTKNNLSVSHTNVIVVGKVVRSEPFVQSHITVTVSEWCRC